MPPKNLNIIDYLAMLEQEFPGFSPPRLVQLGTRVAELEFEKYAGHFAARRFDKYGAMLAEALEMLRRAARDAEAVSGPEIDEAQQKAGKAARMLANKLDERDARDTGLQSIIAAVCGTVNYLKTQDPLYMIGVWRAPRQNEQAARDVDLATPQAQVYYAQLAPRFGDQIELLWRLKARMGI
jgi:cell division septum initiation protein DivIVA